MKRKLCFFALAILLSLALCASGCANGQNAGKDLCNHSWQSASCVSAQKCKLCGQLQGAPLGHTGGTATEEKGPVCDRCGEMYGIPLAHTHSFTDWCPNGDGTHSRFCQADRSHREDGACFGGAANVADGTVCESCGYVQDSTHVHVFEQQVVADVYLLSAAGCESGAQYLYSCSCGVAGTEIFVQGDALGHQEVIDEGKHATFSLEGLTEGSHCDRCGAVLIAQTVIPALGSDVAVDTDYMEQEGNITYRYSYSFTFYENDRFNLTTLKVGSDKSYELTGEDGSLNFLDNGVYELVFDSGRDSMYITIKNGKVEFCEKDGSPLKGGHDKRPHGETVIQITPRPGNSVYGYLDLARNSHGKSMQELYYRLYAACEAFMDSRQNVEQHNGAYPIDKVNLDYYILTADEAVAVWKVFLIENPRYYWLSNTLSISKGQLEICIDPAYVDAAYRLKCDEAIAAMEQACGNALDGKRNDLEKAMAIHDFVLAKLNYAYEDDGVTPQDDIWAHNLIGIAEKGQGVCESYAKAYQYLCRINGLDCMVVTGFNRENHAWNLVKIDSKWYGVDCTFDETNKEEVSYACFGMPASRLDEEYQEDSPKNHGTGYLYGLPEVSERGIELVDLYKNGSYLGVYESIDAAFRAMTDSNAEYEISLHLYEFRGALLLSTAVVEHHIYSKSTPDVRHLTIRQKFDEIVSGYYSIHRVYLRDGLKLNSDLAIYNLDITGSGTLDLQSNTLSCFGKIIYISVPVEGSMRSDAPSVVEMGDLEHYVTFWSTVQVHTIKQIEDRFTGYQFRADTHVVELYAYDFEVYDALSEGIHATIDHFHALKTEKWGPSPRMTVSGAANVHVGRITSEDDHVYILIKFGKLEEFGHLTLGKSETQILLRIHGMQRYIVTDVNGEVVSERTEVADLSQLTEPLLKLEDPSVMANMVISVLEDFDRDSYRDVTAEYMLDDNNQVVRKP